MTYCIRHFDSFQALPDRYAALVATATETGGLFWDAEWFEVLMRQVFNNGDIFRIYSVEDADSGRPRLLAPLRYLINDHSIPGARVFASVSHPENFADAAFLFGPDAEHKGALLTALFRHLRTVTAIAGGGAGCDAMRLWPLAENSELEQLVGAALQAAGFKVQRYANSYNRFETTADIAYDSYFTQRSANLRYSVRRRQRALQKTGQLELALYTKPAELEGNMSDYIAVSLASWKSPPSMLGGEIVKLMQLAAEKGGLRLGVLRLYCKAVAIQFWVVTGGTAHCVRLAYCKTHKHLAVGVVLTNFMIAHMLEQDRVRKIDFGYGPEDYKGGWMKEAQNYSGYMAFNPATRRGLSHGAVHILGQPLKRVVKTAARLLRKKS